MLDLRDPNRIPEKAWHTDVRSSPAGWVPIHPVEIWLEEL